MAAGRLVCVVSVVTGEPTLRPSGVDVQDEGGGDNVVAPPGPPACKLMYHVGVVGLKSVSSPPKLGHSVVLKDGPDLVGVHFQLEGQLELYPRLLRV
jgi:hypothetical protein